MSLTLQSKQSSNFNPHPEGIHPAVCVDVMDLGLVEVEFQGKRKMVNKLRVVFETEQKTEDGRNCTVSKKFTASLHPKAKLAEFLGKWRGRPVVPGDTIDLGKLIGACCTLVISHQQSLTGHTYAAIDAISRPTKKLTPSGFYDPVAARQRMEDWRAREAGTPARSAERGAGSQNGVSVGQCSGVPVGQPGGRGAGAAVGQPTGQAAGQPVSGDDDLPF